MVSESVICVPHMKSRIFISYSHADEEYRQRLDTHLSMLKREGRVELWTDRRIEPGDEWGHQIRSELEAADIIVLMISPEFIASDYCWDVEVARAMERHEAREAIVVPIIVRVCDWHSAPFSKLQALPAEAKPIKKWHDLDEAYQSITDGLKKLLPQEGWGGEAATPSAAPGRSAEPTAASLPRSGNLSVRKEFTQRDKDKFLDETFEFIASYFEGSLQELERRNPEIETRFKRIDAQRFVATVYRQGDKAAACTIFQNSQFWRGISYHNGDDGSVEMLNESLSVEVDAAGLSLGSWGTGFSGKPESKLTLEGAAEHYWSMLIRPLQH